MFQYKALLKSNKEIVVAEGHNIQDVEHGVVHFRRQQKKGLHTQGNEPVEIYHVKRNKVSGKHQDELIKVI